MTTKRWSPPLPLWYSIFSHNREKNVDRIEIRPQVKCADTQHPMFEQTDKITLFNYLLCKRFKQFTNSCVLMNKYYFIIFFLLIYQNIHKPRPWAIFGNTFFAHIQKIKQTVSLCVCVCVSVLLILGISF